MPRGPSRPYPVVSLPKAVGIAEGLRDHNAGRPMNRILLAEALGYSPAGLSFRDTVTAASKYGLVAGNYNSETLALTALGERAVRPASEEERLTALRQSMGRVGLFGKLLEHFDNNRLPSPDLLKGILERPPFNVNAAWSKEAAEVFVSNGRFTGVIRDVSGTPYVITASGPPPVEAAVLSSVDAGSDEEAVDTSAIETVEQSPVTDPRTSSPETPRQFFIAHGRDKTALTQLQKILRDLDIPYMVAEEEANAGRPISQKVGDLMRSCSAGIFIFSGDEEVTNPEGVTIKRPRPNVVYELGAASFQYGQRIVIFKEHGVEFPTDFRDLGYIEYEKGQLSATAMELLRELIKLRAVRIMPGS